MDIAITFDIEFDINGAFSEPGKRSPRGRESLVCLADGQDIGIGRILDMLEAHDLKATFFIETLQTAWFGPEPMGAIARDLHSRGHDLQLHLHPVWLRFDEPDWARRVQERRPVASRDDSLLAMAPERVVEVISRGLAVFDSWQLPRPKAVRTGSLIMGRTLYSAFRAFGLTLSSSVGCGIFQPRDPDLVLHSGARWLDQVMEVPVTTYLGADRWLRTTNRLATLVGMGIDEQRALLAVAAREKVPLLVFLSHVSEFVRFSDTNAKAAANRLTVRKFERLCHAIATSDHLQAVTMSQLADRSPAGYPDIRLALPKAVSAARFLDRALPGRGLW